jgi:hypothetical protein
VFAWLIERTDMPFAAQPVAVLLPLVIPGVLSRWLDAVTAAQPA